MNFWTGSVSPPQAQRALRELLQGHAPESGARRRARFTSRALIILDEPLTGLDAGSARQVKTVLRERARAGGTIIMTTHILEVAERMADRIGVIAHGRLIAEGTLDELRLQRPARRPAPARRSLEDTFLALVAEQAQAA